jgi:hypothetical protein
MAAATTITHKKPFSSIPEEFELLDQLVKWGAASEFVCEASKERAKAPLSRKMKTYTYSVSLLLPDDYIQRIFAHLLKEIGPLSKSFLRYSFRSDFVRNRQLKGQTGSGEYSVTACLHPYSFQVDGKIGYRLGGIFFDESIRELALSIFCKHAVFHTDVLDILIPLYEENVQLIAEYAREL